MARRFATLPADSSTVGTALARLVAPEEVAVRGRKSAAVKVEALDADGSVIKGVLVALKATGLSCRVSVLSFDADADHGSRT